MLNIRGVCNITRKVYLWGVHIQFNINNHPMTAPKTLWSMAMATFLAIITLLFCACSEKQVSAYNPNVDGFTSGQVSCSGSIVLVLSKDVDEETQKSVDLSKLLSLSPSAEGRVAFADARTVVFTPSVPLERGTEYTVTADIRAMFPDVEEEYRAFSFSVRTRPLYYQGYLDGIEEKEENVYDFTFNIVTSDSEDAATVEKSVVASMGAATWEHGDGMRHTMTVEVKAVKERQTLTLVVSDEKGANRELVSTEVPSSGEMSVMNVQMRNGDASYVEVTFSKRLSGKQDMKGLAYIVDNESETVDVVGNTLRLYPDAGKRGTVEVFLSSSIKSSTGAKLGEDKRVNVSVDSSEPHAAFTTKNVVVPLTENVTVPFRAIYMRGVRVKVYRIYSNNVVRMLSENDLDGGDNLARYGRPVAVKTILFDEGTDFRDWHTYSLDLTGMFKAEPGAMYHIVLDTPMELSAWPGVEQEQKSLEELEKEDRVILAELNTKFDSGDTWFSESYYDWEEYDWHEESDPSKASYYMALDRSSRNVLATNIGLSAFVDDDNVANVVALDLLSAKPMAGVTVKAYNFQNQVIGTAETNDEGVAVVVPAENNGRPFYIEGIKGEDHSYLRTKLAEDLSTSSFDVSGAETHAGGLKGFIYGERGVWRPGDTLHIAFMLQDPQGKLPESHPVVLEVTNTLGQLVSQQTRKGGEMGLYTFSVPTDEGAVTGSWTAKVTVGGATFSKRLRVETIKPNRLKINVDVPSMIEVGQVLPLHAEWLTGAKSGGRRYETEVTMEATKTTFSKWPGFVFDDPTRTYSTNELEVASGVTDENGDAKVTFDPEIDMGVPGMLRANVVTRVYEPGGEFSTDSRFALVSPYKSYVGILNPQPDRTRLATGSDHTITVAAVDKNGKALKGEAITVEVYRMSYYWWWSASDELADFNSGRYYKPVKTYNLVSGANGKATFKLNFADRDWGTYLVRACDSGSGHAASLLTYFDWPSMYYRTRDGGESSTELKVKTDKEEYKVGEKMTVSFPSSAGAQGIINLCRGGSTIGTKMVDCTAEQTSVEIDVTSDMAPNVYAFVSMVQPYNRTTNDAPMRLYGVAQAMVTSDETHLSPVVMSVDEFKPLTKAKVTVGEKDGKPMAYTLAIVDEGLLDLTQFKTPNAWSSFYARQALGVSLWDIYNQVAGAYGGRIEQLFSIGGDQDLLNNSPKAIVNRFTPMVYFAGPFTLKKGEKRVHEVAIPNYVGRVRVMVVGTDGRACGSVDKSVKVSKSLMMYGTMPRQIGVKDVAKVSATVVADKAVGDVEVKIAAAGGVKVVGESKQMVNFKKGGDRTVWFEIEAGDEAAESTVSVVAKCASDKADYTTKLKVRYAGQTMSVAENAVIKPGKEWALDLKAKQGKMESAMVELGTHEPLNMASRVYELVRYPHGCAEQKTSKALSQLYLDMFADLSDGQKAEVEVNVKSVISRLGGHVTSVGGMAYWSGDPDPNFWCSAYVYIFLTEAESRGYYVPANIKKNLAAYLTKTIGTYCEEHNALALYALALDNKANLSLMNSLRERLNGKAQGCYVGDAYNLLAAAYALAGYKKEAAALLKAGGEAGTPWRLLAETLTDDANAPKTAETLRLRLASRGWMSTYETGTTLMAWSHYAKKRQAKGMLKAAVYVDKEKVASVDTKKSTWNSAVDVTAKGIRVKNEGEGDVFVTLTTTAQIGQGQVRASDNGLSIDVSYTDDSGSWKSTENMQAGDVFGAKVEVSNTTGRELEHVAVTFIMPAGVEALSVEEGELCSYVDVRDDRVLFYADNLGIGKTFHIDVKLSATYAGRYYQPAITAEAMYDNTVNGSTDSGEVTIR